MADIHLDKIPRDQALKVAKEVFQMTDQQAEEFVSLARGEAVSDVTTAKALKEVLGPDSMFVRLKALYGGTTNLQTGSGNSKTGSLGKTKMGGGLRKTGSLGNTVFGAGSRRTGAIGNLQTGSGNRKTGALPGKVDSGSGNAKTGSLGTEEKVHQRYFKPGRKISVLLHRNKEYRGTPDPKDLSAATFKYSASQAREPAGAPGGGRWTKGGGSAVAAARGIAQRVWRKGAGARKTYQAVGLGVAHGALAHQAGSGLYGGVKAALEGDTRGALLHGARYVAGRAGLQGLTGPAINRLDRRGQAIAHTTAGVTAVVLGVGPKYFGHAARGAARGASRRFRTRGNSAAHNWAKHQDNMARASARPFKHSSGMIIEHHRGTVPQSKALVVRGKAQGELTRKPIIQIAAETKQMLAAKRSGKKIAAKPPLRASFQLPVKRHKPVPPAPPPGPSTVMHVHNHFGPRPKNAMKKLPAKKKEASPMTKCPDCGMMMSSGAKTCSKCGATMGKKEITAMSFVFKEGDNYRWVLLSSNGFRDRDGEIIATKALERDVALWELEGRPADPLRWWHVSLTPDYARGVEVGHTDFRMVHGHTLIESGEFIDPVVGEAVFKAQNELAASVGFRHSPNEPNSDKIFNAVHIFERSLLPKGRQSNSLTQLVVN